MTSCPKHSIYRHTDRTFHSLSLVSESKDDVCRAEITRLTVMLCKIVVHIWTSVQVLSFVVVKISLLLLNIVSTSFTKPNCSIRVLPTLEFFLFTCVNLFQIWLVTARQRKGNAFSFIPLWRVFRPFYWLIWIGSENILNH